MKGTQPGQLIPTHQREILDLMASCSAYKARGRRGEVGDVEGDGMSSQVTAIHQGALHFLEMIWTWEVVN